MKSPSSTTLRIPPASPPYDAHAAEDLAALMPPGMEPIGLFRTLAKNPRVLRRIRRGGLLDAGSITVRHREIAILRTTARAGAEYEWGVHVAFFGAAAGLDDALLVLPGLYRAIAYVVLGSGVELEPRFPAVRS